MTIAGSLLMYIGKLIFYVILAVLGIFAGKKLADHKKGKNASEQSDGRTKE